MRKIGSLFAAVLLFLGAIPSMAQATYTDDDGTEYEFKGYW